MYIIYYINLLFVVVMVMADEVIDELFDEGFLYIFVLYIYLFNIVIKKKINIILYYHILI